jgi:hypothetical protein
MQFRNYLCILIIYMVRTMFQNIEVKSPMYDMICNLMISSNIKMHCNI